MNTRQNRLGVSGIQSSPAAIITILALAGSYAQNSAIAQIKPGSVPQDQYSAGILAGTQIAVALSERKDRILAALGTGESLPIDVAQAFTVFVEGVLPEMRAAKAEIFQTEPEVHAFDLVAGQMIALYQALNRKGDERTSGYASSFDAAPGQVSVMHITGAPAAVAQVLRQVGLVPGAQQPATPAFESAWNAPAFYSVTTQDGTVVEICASERPAMGAEKTRVLAQALQVVTNGVPALFEEQGEAVVGQQRVAVKSAHGYTIRFSSANPLTAQNIRQICNEAATAFKKVVPVDAQIGGVRGEVWGVLAFDTTGYNAGGSENGATTARRRAAALA